MSPAPTPGAAGPGAFATTGLPLLAGDVGGTKTELALFERRADRLVRGRTERFPSAAYESLEAIVRAFLRGEPAGRVEAACFAVAGPVEGGSADITNLPWTVEDRALGELLGTEQVKLLNDLQAAAYGMLWLEPEAFRILRAVDPPRQGTIAVIAPGTGLGEAALCWDGAHHHPVASEGGHGDFAPRDERQIALLRHLQVRFGGHVSYERVLSGDGLHDVYRFLREAGVAPEPPGFADRLARGDPNAAISEAALRGESALCVEALDLFCEVLGAEAGNLALRAFAAGGLIVGGGIAPRIVPALEKGGFLAAFSDKGRLSAWLRTIPVRVALDARAPLVGAANALLAGAGHWPSDW